MSDVKKIREIYKNHRHLEPVIKVQFPGCNRKSEVYLYDYGSQLEKSIIKKNKEIESLKRQLEEQRADHVDHLLSIKNKLPSIFA